MSSETDRGDDAPYHVHIYHGPGERGRSEALHARLTELKASGALPDLLMVGKVREGKAGPHPIPQFEIHFPKRALPQILPLIEASGLRALVHPLTDDDLADHTHLAHWIGEPVELDLTTLDPPGKNQGIARYAKSDF
jgi:aromatic ring-cleaving dioxygenase